MLVSSLVDSAPISQDRTAREHSCLGFTTTNSSWADSDLKAHSPLARWASLVGIIPNSCPPIPLSEAYSDNENFMFGKPKPWLLLKLQDVLVVPKT
jgi:hypothetical protein